MSGEDNAVIFGGETTQRVETFDDVMIDIETMSLHPSKALILSIGLLEFDPRPTAAGLKLGKHELILPSVEEQLWLGRRVDKGTQKFWADQPEEARRHWTNYQGERDDAIRTLSRIKEFVKDKTRVWANGIQFDLSNILGLAEDVGLAEEVFWHYRAPRDMRTFCAETAQTRIEPSDFKPPFRMVAHEPVSDCITQAMHVWAHWQDPQR